MFPFLIGTVRTYVWETLFYDPDSFPFLIGTVRTFLTFLVLSLGLGFHSS